MNQRFSLGLVGRTVLGASLLGLSFAAGCSDDPEPMVDAGRDSGVSEDSGMTDAGTTDDAGAIDGGADDAGPSDGGVAPLPGAAVLFVDRESDRPTLAYVTAAGVLVEGGPTTGPAIGTWDYAAGVVDAATDTARVLFYDSVAGGGRYVSIDLRTREATILNMTLVVSAGWDHIVPIACDAATCDRYYFHDADRIGGGDPLVAVAEVSVDTTGAWMWLQTDSGTLAGAPYDDAWRMAWDDGGTARIGMHRASDGFFGRLAITTGGATRGQFVRAGATITVDARGGTFPGFELATPLAEVGYLAGSGTTDDVLVYRRTGAASIARMSAGSATGLIDYPAAAFGVWDEIVTVDNGPTLFYSRTLPGVVGQFSVDPPPGFENIDTFATPGVGFEHVTALITRHVP